MYPKSQFKSMRLWRSLLTALLCFSSGLMPLPAQVIAAPQRAAKTQTLFQTPASFRPPKGRGAPRQSVGAGTRGNCMATESTGSQAQKPLTAIVPVNRADTNNSVGLTLSEHPTFLIYIPKTTAKTAEFYLEEELPSAVGSSAQAKALYTTQVSLPRQAGFIKVQLPQNNIALEPGKIYRWYFTLNCSDSNDPTANAGAPFVSGIVQRVDQPDLAQQLSSVPVIQQVALYGKAGIWYDMIAALADLRRSRPTDATLTTKWVTELSSDVVGLPELSGEPLISCCSSRN
ncbi:MAG: DUF928 domain-containing protein [Oscillatoriales cyanobacterium SM2_3_0]|nr:DUF928 domain-containing protein [Oscillatoriales cyanobacterium SM2_3_0]